MAEWLWCTTMPPWWWFGTQYHMFSSFLCLLADNTSYHGCSSICSLQAAGSLHYLVSMLDEADLWLAPWLWVLWAFCTSSSSLCLSSCSWTSTSGGWCCSLRRVSSCKSASFSFSSCRQSRSRSASARPDQLSLSNLASWCWMLDTLKARHRVVKICKSL